MLTINIQPIDIPIKPGVTDSAVSISIISVQVQLNESANIIYQYNNASGIALLTGNILMLGTAYSQWGNNDDIVAEFLITSLQLIRA